MCCVRRRGAVGQCGVVCVAGVRLDSVVLCVWLGRVALRGMRHTATLAGFSLGLGLVAVANDLTSKLAVAGPGADSASAAVKASARAAQLLQVVQALTKVRATRRPAAPVFAVDASLYSSCARALPLYPTVSPPPPFVCS